MRWCAAASAFALASLAWGVVIDQVAIVIGNAIIKDSDIQRDIRVVSFLNRQPLEFGPTARKTATNRLIDQAFIRREIRLGDYQPATLQDAEKQLNVLKQDRFKIPAGYESALKRYGITDLELRSQFQWQLTVLNFIDIRFRPAAYVSDPDIEKYYIDHKDALERQFPGKKSLNDLREDIRTILAGEKVNQMFFSWLDEQRKNSKIQYLEAGLR